MKKAIAILLAVSMIAGIASCSKEPERKRKKDSGKSKKTEETDDDFEDFTEETIEDIVETTRKKKKDKTKETIPVPDGAYCLDGKSPEEIVEVGKFFADIKDNDSFIDIYKRVEVAPTNYDVNSLDKYNASISFMLYTDVGVSSLGGLRYQFLYYHIEHCSCSKGQKVRHHWCYGRCQQQYQRSAYRLYNAAQTAYSKRFPSAIAGCAEWH